MATIDRTLPKETLNPAVTAQRSASMGSRMTYSRLIGALFLAGFVVYGVGFGLTSSVLGAPDFLSTISAHQGTLVLGAFLMLLVAPVDVGKAVLFFPIVEYHGKKTALAYLAAMIVEVVLLTIGALCLLMLVPLAHSAVGTGAAQVLGSLLTEANTMAYQIGQLSLGIGAFFLCWLLFRTRLLPRWLAGMGVIGYALHAAGAIAEIFGIPISLILLIPGGIFELAVAFWLLTRGFQPEAYAKGFQPEAYGAHAEVRSSDAPDRPPIPSRAIAEGEAR
jgi:hypothetical protein